MAQTAKFDFSCCQVCAEIS